MTLINDRGLEIVRLSSEIRIPAEITSHII